jgi:molecular chaperone Hsp33
MMTGGTAPSSSTGFDQVLAFTIADRNARGRIVRLGPTLDAVIAAHSYPAPIRHLLAEALVLAALLGSLLKDEQGQLTMQAQTQDGVVDLLVCDYRAGEVRGYARFDRARLDELGPNPSLHALFGAGYLAITFDLATSGQRYQGIVPLEGETLAAACESYFVQSEQIPTLIRVAVRSDAAGCVAGGLLIQHLPEGEEGRERLHVLLDHPEWEHMRIMGGAISPVELVDPALSLEDLLWRLFHEEREVRVQPAAQISKGCRCSSSYYQSVLSRFGPAEREDMKNEDGVVLVDCAFCSRVFEIEFD